MMGKWIGIIFGVVALSSAGLVGAQNKSNGSGNLTPSSRPIIEVPAYVPQYGVIPQFQDGDRVAFIGDSITHWGSYVYGVTGFYQTRFPARHIHWIYMGIGGYTAKKWLENFDAISATRPTVAVIMLGMNDSGKGKPWRLPEGAKKEEEKTANLAAYQANMDELIGRLQDIGVVRFVLISPSIYDETSDAKREVYVGKNAFMKDEYGAYLVAKAAEIGADLIGFNTPMLELTTLLQSAYGNGFSLLDLKDRIHPTVGGHIYMAYMFLRAQGLEGKVSETEVSAKDVAVVKNDNCSISGLSVDGNRLLWNYSANSLPYPLSIPGNPRLFESPTVREKGNRKAAAFAEGWGNSLYFSRDFNGEILRITGLSADNYTLEIDGIEIGIFSAAELDDGIDLATYPETPQYRQAVDIHSWKASKDDYALSSAYGYWVVKDPDTCLGSNSDEQMLAIQRASQPVVRQFVLAGELFSAKNKE